MFPVYLKLSQASVFSVPNIQSKFEAFKTSQCVKYLYVHIIMHHSLICQMQNTPGTWDRHHAGMWKMYFSSVVKLLLYIKGGRLTRNPLIYHKQQ